jgi:hypothetical protein
LVCWISLSLKFEEYLIIGCWDIPFWIFYKIGARLAGWLMKIQPLFGPSFILLGWDKSFLRAEFGNMTKRESCYRELCSLVAPTEKYFCRREWNGHWCIFWQWKVNPYSLKGMLHVFFDRMWMLTKDSRSDGNRAAIHISEGIALQIPWPNVNHDLIMKISLQSSLKSFITIKNQALWHMTVLKTQETQ